MSWFVALVDRHSHGPVERSLASLGIPAFYPRLRRWVSHARSKVAAERPLLGPYLFTEVDRLADFHAARMVFGFRAFLVAVDGAPAVIADEVVFDFRERYMRGEFDLTVRNIPVGALVRVIEGEFAEQLAIVTGAQRGKVVITARGSRRRVVTQRSNITAA